MRVFSFFVFLISAFVLGGCNDRKPHHIKIINVSNKEIVIESASVNDLQMASSLLAVDPIYDDSYGMAVDYALVDLKKGDSLVLDLVDGDFRKRLSCVKRDDNDSECIYFVKYNGSDEIVCWCDSFSDFYN